MILNEKEKNDDTYSESIIEIKNMNLLSSKLKYLTVWIDCNKFS